MAFLNADFKSSKLSIIVPVFNEAPNILDNLQQLINEVEGHFSNYELIVISDGSTDDTNDRLLSFRHPKLIALLEEKNSGKGNVVRLGFERATGDYLLFIDGGMEIHPKEIRIFMGLMGLYDCDIVIGSKRHPQSRVHYPWYRRLLSWLFQNLVRFLFRLNVTDTQVGIKLFRAEVIRAVLPHLRINRYGFDLEILCLAKWAGYERVLEAPIRMDYFNKNKRFIVAELLHVFHIGLSLVGDTFKLSRYLRMLKRNHIKASQTSTKIGRKAG